jgi:trimeric autotransporter adhesin
MSTIKISQLPAKGANLEATDLVEISEFNGSGYVSKSITGQEIIDGASGGGVTDVTATAPLSSTGGSTPDIAITQAGAADDGYLSTGDWNAFNNKQDALSSGVNIKTLNGASLLGSGGLSVQPTLVSGTNIKTINGNSVLGSGDLTISGATYPTKLANSFSGVQITGQTVAISDSLYIPANTITATDYFLQINASLYRTFSGSGGGVLGWLYLNTTNSLTGATLIGRSGQISSGQQWSGFIRNFPVKTTTAYGLGTGNQFGQDFTSNSGFTFTFNKAQNNYLIFAISSVNVNDGGTWVNSKADLYV